MKVKLSVGATKQGEQINTTVQVRSQGKLKMSKQHTEIQFVRVRVKNLTIGNNVQTQATRAKIKNKTTGAQQIENPSQ